MTWLNTTPDEVRAMACDPVDDSPLSDDELDELEAWLLFNTAAECGMPQGGVTLSTTFLGSSERFTSCGAPRCRLTGYGRCSPTLHRSRRSSCPGACSAPTRPIRPG